MAKIREVSPHYGFKCPGCQVEHFFNGSWQFNKDFNKPTINPSLLVTTGRDPTSKCHSYIKDGYIQFLDDSWHALKGKTVELPDYE